MPQGHISANMMGGGDEEKKNTTRIIIYAGSVESHRTNPRLCMNWSNPKNMYYLRTDSKLLRLP